MSLAVLQAVVLPCGPLTRLSFLPSPERLDMMPEASTCSCTLFLPKYSS